MLIIYKYKFMNRCETIELPADAEILDIQIQDYEATMWVLLNTEDEKIERTFKMFGTGVEIKIIDSEHFYEYLSTVQFENEEVYHIFEIIKI